MFRKVIKNILGFYYHGTHLVGYWSPKKGGKGKGRWVVRMVSQRKEGPFFGAWDPLVGPGKGSTIKFEWTRELA